MAIVVNLAGTSPTDLKYNSPNRTAANLTAILALTPIYDGEIVLALDTGVRYRGLELVTGRWGQIFVEM
jgi:1,6-anhydro-N-acetylmuramate kinase